MPKPKKGEKRGAYLKRAVPQMMNEGLTQRQAVGKAEGWYDNVNKKKKRTTK